MKLLNPIWLVFNKRTLMVHKVIVQVGRQTKFQSQEKVIVTSDDWKVSGTVFFPISILVSSIKMQVKKLWYVCGLFA